MIAGQRALASLISIGVLVASAQLAIAQPSPHVARVSARIASPSTARTVSGVLVALDDAGHAVTDVDPTAWQARLDGQPAQLSVAAGRPTIGLTVAFLLDSSASPQVREAVRGAVADSLRGIDVNRDAVAIVSTSDSRGWDQAAFSTSTDDLGARLDQVVQVEPNDALLTLDQVSAAARALAAQERDARVLLLITNRSLASVATAATSLGSIRNFVVDKGIQVSVVALSGAGGQGAAEALAEPTPNGRVEYALNSTSTVDLTRRVSLLLAPVFGARRFELPAPSEGMHTLSIGLPGTMLEATTSFAVAGRAVGIAALETAAGPLLPGTELKDPINVVARPDEAAPIDSVDWYVDGRVTSVASEPWALQLDPEQLGEGSHQLAARIISQGRSGPLASTSLYVQTDVFRGVRSYLGNWSVVVLLLIANGLALLLFLRMRSVRSGSANMTEFPPTLRLNALGGKYVAPEVLHFPARGKLRIGYHPPYMDNTVGSREFSRLAFQDVRGDEDAVRDLSRHVGCIWRDPKTNDCFVQLGWPGPGEPVVPKPQSQVFHFGRPQDATSAPFRLAHHDVVRLASGIEFVFNQVGLRDKATPEGRKLGPFDAGVGQPPIVLNLGDRRRKAERAEEG